MVPEWRPVITRAATFADDTDGSYVAAWASCSYKSCKIANHGDNSNFTVILIITIMQWSTFVRQWLATAVADPSFFGRG